MATLQAKLILIDRPIISAFLSYETKTGFDTALAASFRPQRRVLNEDYRNRYRGVPYTHRFGAIIHQVYTALSNTFIAVYLTCRVFWPAQYLEVLIKLLAVRYCP